MALLTLFDWKKDPRFSRDSKTVGGLLSSGTIEESSTDGNGVFSKAGLPTAAEWLIAGEEGAAATENPCPEDPLLKRDGRASSPATLAPLLEPLMVAPVTDESNVLPNEAVAVKAESP